MSTLQWTPPLRFVVALVLGFLMGLEREKPAWASLHVPLILVLALA